MVPWKENTRMSLRLEFVILALAGKVNLSRLCKQFGISRKPGPCTNQLASIGAGVILDVGDKQATVDDSDYSGIRCT